MATLYEIINELDEVMSAAQVDEETGEVLVDWERLEALNLAKEQKVENIGLFILNLRAEQNALAERKKAIEKRIKSLDSKLAGLNGYLERCLNGEAFKCTDFEVKFTKSERVEITDAFFLNSFNERFYKTDVKPNKAEIKQAIKDGYFIEGAKLVECLNMNLK